MEPGLIAGDYIFVDKTHVGARIFDLISAANGEEFNIYRIPGLGEIKRNDVLVFNFPYPENNDSITFDLLKYYIKRCVALPGDTIKIENGFYMIQGIEESLGNYNSQRELSVMEDTEMYYIQLQSYPWSEKMPWTIKEFGPLLIPAKEQKIEMNEGTYTLYRQIISWEQKKKLTLDENHVFLNDSLITHYTFSKNYYFMAGDKNTNSQDSRYWGVLPEEYIVGKASLIWKSVNPSDGKVRWNRIFKRII